MMSDWPNAQTDCPSHGTLGQWVQPWRYGQCDDSSIRLSFWPFLHVAQFRIPVRCNANRARWVGGGTQAIMHINAYDGVSAAWPTAFGQQQSSFCDETDSLNVIPGRPGIPGMNISIPEFLGMKWIPYFVSMACSLVRDNTHWHKI